MKKAMITGLAGLVLSASSCNSIDNYLIQKYENYQQQQKEELREDVYGVIENKITLRTKTNYFEKEDKNRKTPDVKEWFGEGVIVGDYIITADHVTSFNERIMRAPFGGVIRKPIDKVSEETYIKGTDYKLEEVMSDEVRDISIFKLPEGYERPDYRVEMGESKDLDLLDEVYLVGDPRDKFEILRKGIIANRDIDFQDKSGMDINGIVLDMAGIGGDSGSPLIDEEGKLVGILSMSAYGFATVMKPVEWYKNEIEKYENGQAGRDS